MLNNPWLSLAAQSAHLCLEAQDVVGLRMAKAVSGEFDACEEAVRMVTEKSLALWEAGMVIGQSLAAGEGHLAAERTVVLLRGRVQANQRRLHGQRPTDHEDL